MLTLRRRAVPRSAAAAVPAPRSPDDDRLASAARWWASRHGYLDDGTASPGTVRAVVERHHLGGWAGLARAVALAGAPTTSAAGGPSSLL